MSIDLSDELRLLQTELAEVKAEYHDFVYTVTHDLAAPLRQIEGFATIVLTNHGDQFDDKTRRHLDLIVKGSQKGNEILEALHGYSRLITADYSIVSVDCNKIITKVKTELASLTAHNDAQITYQGPSIIIGDYSQLYLLFYHLIHNALHYQSHEVPPEVSIKTEERDQHWQFCVQDNGIGFQQKLADRIFIALKRGVSEKNHPGIGMGLTIARSIVQRHGGKIWATTEQGKGSSFYFTISKADSSE